MFGFHAKNHAPDKVYQLRRDLVLYAARQKFLIFKHNFLLKMQNPTESMTLSGISFAHGLFHSIVDKVCDDLPV